MEAKNANRIRGDNDDFYEENDDREAPLMSCLLLSGLKRVVIMVVTCSAFDLGERWQIENDDNGQSLADDSLILKHFRKANKN